MASPPQQVQVRWSSSAPFAIAIDRLVANLTGPLHSLQEVSSLENGCSQAKEGLFALRLALSCADSEDLAEYARPWFRDLRGYDILTRLVRLVTEGYSSAVSSLAGSAEAEETVHEQEEHGEIHEGEKETPDDLLSILRDVLYIFTQISKDNKTEEKIFQVQHAEDLGNALTGLFQHLDNKRQDSPLLDTERLCSILLATSIDSESGINEDFFTTSRKLTEEFSEQQLGFSHVHDTIVSLLKVNRAIVNPCLFSLFLRIWLKQNSEWPSYPNQLRWAIPICLQVVIDYDPENRLLIHSQGVLSSLIRYTLSSDRTEEDRRLYRSLAKSLCCEGIPNLEDAAYLFKKAHTSAEASSFLLDTMKLSDSPAYFHFSFARHGPSSIELAALPRPFPPAPTTGYTIALWVRFDSFDSDSDTILFGANDATQSCFVRVYVEKKSRHLILQTAPAGLRDGACFSSTAFQENRWYHLCLVHKRSRTSASCRASLFIDGEFVEQVKAEYPSSPQNTRPSQRLPHIRTFVGTPKDLAQDAPGGMTTRWSLASAVLIGQGCSDDLIAVFCHIGPRYHGNFQDCLGSFQTYKASTALTSRNETFNTGDDGASDIFTIIRQSGALILPESAVLLNLSPWAVLDNHDYDGNAVNQSQLLKQLSGSAGNHFKRFVMAGKTPLAINLAVPALEDALGLPYGMATFVGSPMISVPHALDDASFQLGGCVPIHLSMIAEAQSPEALHLALGIFLHSVQSNWRNSEAIEAESNYALLAYLLSVKLGLSPAVFSGSFSTTSSPQPAQPLVFDSSHQRNELAMELFLSVLEFVGYSKTNPTESILLNPLAYRILVIDLDVWRQCDLPLLELYYSQYTVFVTQSRHHRFNFRKVIRTRIVKRLIDFLRDEIVTVQTIKPFIATLKTLLKSTLLENARNVAMFITCAVRREKATKELRTKRSSRIDMRHGRFPTYALDSKVLSRQQVGIEVLKAFTEIICDGSTTTPIKKLAKAVTHRWLLYLISEDEPNVVVFAYLILARLIVVVGHDYPKKFGEINGFVVLQHRLKRWWHIPILWPISLAILFGKDVGLMNLERPFDHHGFLDLFETSAIDDITVKCPEILPVITAMLQSGLKATVFRDDHDASLQDDQESLSPPINRTKRSMSNATPDAAVTANKGSLASEELLTTVIGFLGDIHTQSKQFREFAHSSNYIQELMFLLYPVVVNSDIVSPDLELHSGESELSFGSPGLDVSESLEAAPADHSSSFVFINTEAAGSKSSILSSYSSFAPSTSRVKHNINVSKCESITPSIQSNRVLQGILKLIVAVFIDQLLMRKEFSGLNLYLKIPPGFLEHHVSFESWVLRNVLLHIKDTILLDPVVLHEPRVLTNLSRMVVQLGETFFEGRLIQNEILILEFIGPILEYLQHPDVAAFKSTRLCTRTISSMRSVMFRIILVKLSEATESGALAILQKLIYWQTVILHGDDQEFEYLRLLYYFIYVQLTSKAEEVRIAAATLLRTIIVQKPSATAFILGHARSDLRRRLTDGFQQLAGMDDSTFLSWIDQEQEDLEAFFFDVINKNWEAFVRDENVRIEETAKTRSLKRKEILQQWDQIITKQENSIREHDTSFAVWSTKLQHLDDTSHHRMLQDLQDTIMGFVAKLSRIHRDLRNENGLLADHHETKWCLSPTEGRSRMRLSIVPDDTTDNQNYQPKRPKKGPPSSGKTSENDGAQRRSESPGHKEPTKSPSHSTEVSLDDETIPMAESFEFIERPQDELEDNENGYHKVLKSLHRKDDILRIFNVSRVMGLEACEGILLLGKHHLYIIDNFLKRSPDDEIVNVRQATPEERDPYVRIISGKESDSDTTNYHEHEVASWKWSDVVSVSKRRFLLRDVALEAFFSDGRSCLLILMTPTLRNELYTSLSAQAPQISVNGPNTTPGDSWRFDTVKSEEASPQFFGSKFVKAFSQAPHPATRKWLKGEMSNFHYLMIVNTLAGRTFNDLTQYPVFPWVLADYSSEELDLTNPLSFRDLSKPMGAQTPGRESLFRERYQSFADMSDEPPFHYGTHYSSAMIVCSYLTRLQPFVRSFLLLQGGTFDHPDRMFYSIKKAWESAGLSNMSDVRELIPEFFYLPNFLVNINHYDFGNLQNKSQSISEVELPPWAKGDPKIFIQKHREALESTYVTENLHSWIDLIFGYKQKGEAALEATNVFHHLTYHGAKNLDTITDPVQRLATIGIIHNFGQTPHQVFTKPHPSRKVSEPQIRLDTAVTELPRTPWLKHEARGKVAHLIYFAKKDSIISSSPFRICIPPNYDIYMEWGFADNSVRFCTTEGKKQLGLFENLHVGQLSAVAFADAHTLITAGMDSTISIWSCTSTSKNVDLVLSGHLYGHRSPVTVLAVSRSFSTVFSASSNGQIHLWDLNRVEHVRSLPPMGTVDCAQINDSNGNIMICRENFVTLYTLNGEELLHQKVSGESDGGIVSCAFYEGLGNEWLERELLFTGHANGVVNVWSKFIENDHFELALHRQLCHETQRRGSSRGHSITAITPTSHAIYTGVESGHVYEWNIMGLGS